ncbi:Hypothetical predicted protein [Paramuricea clavata]|uniref:Uncharacterized protein n=1 Tax=Paramuricea clavata TaxID=317549 RepID=A0A7D9EUS2_PARCT|nr:Hypothetical predicted protein [Paramuricea clavata]
MSEVQQGEPGSGGRTGNLCVMWNWTQFETNILHQLQLQQGRLPEEKEQTQQSTLVRKTTGKTCC